MRYWIAQDQELRGPFEFTELKNLEGFSKMSLVCPEEERPGEDRQWLDAGSVPALAALFPPQPAEREFPQAIAQDLPLSQVLYQKVERFEERLQGVISELKKRDQTIARLKSDIGERDQKIAALQKDFIKAAGRIDNMDEQLAALRDAGITPPPPEEAKPPEPESAPEPLMKSFPKLERRFDAPPLEEPSPLVESQPVPAPQAPEEPPALSDPLPEPEAVAETAEPVPLPEAAEDGVPEPELEPAPQAPEETEPAPVVEEPRVEPAPAKPSRSRFGALGRMSMGEKIFLAVPVILLLGYFAKQGLEEKEPSKSERALVPPPSAKEPAAKPAARRAPRRRPVRKSRRAPAKKKALPPRPDQGQLRAIAFLKKMPVLEPSIGSCPRSLKTVEASRDRWREVKSLGDFFACAPLTEARGWLPRLERTLSADTKAAASRLRKDIRGWRGLGAVYPVKWKATHLYASRYNVTVRVRPALRYRLRDRYSPGQAKRFSGGVPEGQDGPWEKYRYEVDLKRRTAKPINFRAWKQIDQPSHYAWRRRQPRRPDGRLFPVNNDAEIQEPPVYRAPDAKKPPRRRRPAVKKKSPPEIKNPGRPPGMSPRQGGALPPRPIL